MFFNFRLPPFRLRAAAAFTAVTLCFILAACGGGGDAGTSVFSGPVNRYVGTVVRSCMAARSGVLVAATGKPAYVITTYTFKKTSGTEASGSLYNSYHAASDCSDAEIGRDQIDTTGTLLRIDGSKTFGETRADKVSVLKANTPAGVTVDGITYSAPSAATAATAFTKDIWYLGDDGRGAPGDFDQPLDADGYPAALSTKVVLTKR